MWAIQLRQWWQLLLMGKFCAEVICLQDHRLWNLKIHYLYLTCWCLPASAVHPYVIHISVCGVDPTFKAAWESGANKSKEVQFFLALSSSANLCSQGTVGLFSKLSLHSWPKHTCPGSFQCGKIISVYLNALRRTSLRHHVKQVVIMVSNMVGIIWLSLKALPAVV